MQPDELTYIKRLSQLELERVALVERLADLQRRLRTLDGEYAALKTFLTASSESGKKAPGSSVVEAAYQVLRESGAPLHYKELYSRLTENFFFIGGTAPLANLIVKLNRDRRFMRFGRAVYGLREWTIRLIAAGDPNRSAGSTGDEMETLLDVETERERGRMLGRLETVEVEIKITQMNLRALRRRLKGGVLEALPEGLNPATASRALRERLAKLLEQRESLQERLQGVGDVKKTEGGR